MLLKFLQGVSMYDVCVAFTVTFFVSQYIYVSTETKTLCFAIQQLWKKTVVVLIATEDPPVLLYQEQRLNFSAPIFETIACEPF